MHAGSGGERRDLACQRRFRCNSPDWGGVRPLSNPLLRGVRSAPGRRGWDVTNLARLGPCIGPALVARGGLAESLILATSGWRAAGRERAGTGNALPFLGTDQGRERFHVQR
jgi:hypothetical protein